MTSLLSASERSEKGPPREDFVRRLIRELALNPDECAALDKTLAASRRQLSLPASASLKALLNYKATIFQWNPSIHALAPSSFHPLQR